MNPQIEKLAEQAGFENGHQDRNGNSLSYELEKFAQLLISECLNQCYYRGMNDELYAGQLRAALYIEQHFGVEP
jgi:hypothetical protein